MTGTAAEAMAEKRRLKREALLASPAAQRRAAKLAAQSLERPPRDEPSNGNSFIDAPPTKPRLYRGRQASMSTNSVLDDPSDWTPSKLYPGTSLDSVLAPLPRGYTKLGETQILVFNCSLL